MDMTGWVKNPSEAQELVHTIKKRIRTEIGEWLSCSVGIAPTRFLAKLASKYRKPDGLTILTLQNLDAFYERITLRDVWGINYRMEQRLHALGISTPIALKNAPLGNLLQSLGKYGYSLWANLNGKELTPIVHTEDSSPKSFGHSYCLPKKTTERRYLDAVLLKLCEKTARRMREKKFEAMRISFGIGFTHRKRVLTSKKLHETMFSTECIFSAATHLLNNLYLEDTVNFLSVSVSALVPITHQQSLFSTAKEKKRSISQALDHVNNKYGEFSLMLAPMLNMKSAAQDRIGFRKTEGGY